VCKPWRHFGPTAVVSGYWTVVTARPWNTTATRYIIELLVPESAWQTAMPFLLSGFPASPTCCIDPWMRSQHGIMHYLFADQLTIATADYWNKVASLPPIPPTNIEQACSSYFNHPSNDTWGLNWSTKCQCQVDKLFLPGVQLRYDPQFHIHQWNPNSETFFMTSRKEDKGFGFELFSYYCTTLPLLWRCTLKVEIFSLSFHHINLWIHAWSSKCRKKITNYTV
jgi:hypothetical protein